MFKPPMTTTAKSPEPGYARLLRDNRGFRHLWLGNLISQSGIWFNSVAVFAMLYHYTSAGLAAGVVLAVRFLPGIVAGTFGGVLADRCNRRHLMLWFDGLMAVLVLAFVLADSSTTIVLVYPLTLLLSVSNYFFIAARNAWMPSLVREEEFLFYSGLVELNFATFQAIGGLLGAASVIWFGWRAAFVLNALSFAISAALTFSVKNGEMLSPATVGQPVSNWHAWKVGWQAVWRVRLLRGSFLMEVCFCLGGGGVSVAMTYFALKTYHLGDGGTGLFYGAQGIGGFLTLLLLVPLFARWGRWWQLTLLGWSCAWEELLIIGFALVPTAQLALLAYFGAAVFGYIFDPTVTALLLKAVPGEVRGRALSSWVAVATTCLGLSALTFGAVIDTIGPRLATLIMTVFMITPGLVWVWMVSTRLPPHAVAPGHQ